MNEHSVRDLQTLNAIEDIRRLEARYARYADQKRWEDLAGLFAEDGRFLPLDVDGNEIANMVGREDIATQLASRNAGMQCIHQLLTHEIDIESATTAKAIWAMADLIFRDDSAIPEQQAGGAPPPFRAMRGWGHYRVTYRKVDGQWLIATRTQTRTRLEFAY